MVRLGCSVRQLYSSRRSRSRFAYAWPEQPAGWNASAHFALVRSLADGTAKIDPYRAETGDVGWYRGHYYTAKAPGLALYSLPPWLVLEQDSPDR